MGALELWARGRTLAEAQGITQEIGDAIAGAAEAELEAGRLQAARTILDGLVVTNQRDAGAWTLLSRTHRRLANPLAARFCAEVAVRLAPGEGRARLARAECLLGCSGERAAGRAELAALAGDPDPAVGPRARALLGALGQ